MNGTLTVVLDEVGERSPTTVGRYAAALTHALATTAPTGFEIAAMTSKVSESREQRIRDLLPGVGELRQTAMPARELRQAWLHSLTTLPVHGLVHATSLLAPLALEPEPGDQVTVTVHGLQSLSDRSVRKQRWFDRALRRALRRADGIVVPSTAVAEDLQLLHDLGDRVRVVHPAPVVARALPADGGATSTLRLPDEYVLAITVPGARAQAEALIETVASPSMPDARVVVAGPVQWGEATLAAMAVEAGLPPGRLVMLGDLDAAQLAVAHHRALAHLHVSEVDALGLSLLDAAALGTPTVHPANRSLREIAGDASVPVHGGPHELAAALAALLADDGERARLGLHAMDRARAFTWEAAAQQVWRLHAEL